MTTTLENAKISGFENRVQILGLSSTFDTQALLNAELAILEMRKEPMETSLSAYETDAESWKAFKSSVSNFNNIIKGLADIDSSNKEVKSTNSGITATATGSAIDTDYSIEVNRLATKHRVTSDKFAGDTIGINEIVQLNGTDLEIKEDMTLKDIATAINGGDYNTNAVVLDGRLVLTSKSQGSANSIQLSNSDTWNTIGLTTDGVIKNELQAANDASFTINGVLLSSSNNSYNDIDGLKINFTTVTTEPAELNISRTADNLVEKTTAFVNSYNTMIGNLNFMSGEGGEMQGESLLRNLKNKMNSLLSSSSFAGNTLRTIGISLTSANDGTIELNDSKLREVFEKTPDVISNLLSGDNGVAGKLLAFNETYTDVDGLIDGKLNSINKRIENVNKSIESFELQFEKQTQTLLLKYATFETTMNSLNSQADMVKAILGIKNDDDN